MQASDVHPFYHQVFPVQYKSIMEPFHTFIQGIEIIPFSHFHVNKRPYDCSSCAELCTLDTGKRNEAGKVGEYYLWYIMVGVVFYGTRHADGFAISFLPESNAGVYLSLEPGKRPAGSQFIPLNGYHTFA